jgi:hypothetical protein
MKKTRPTHEEHLVFAQHFHEVRSKLRDLRTTAGCFPKHHRISNTFRKINRRLDRLQDELDNEFQAVTTDAQFRESGPIYYRCR